MYRASKPRCLSAVATLQLEGTSEIAIGRFLILEARGRSALDELIDETGRDLLESRPQRLHSRVQVMRRPLGGRQLLWQG